MDTLRQEAIKEGYAEKGKQVNVFNEAFLGTIRNFGRLYEVGLLMQFNIKTGNLMKDMKFGAPMALRGLASPIPHRIKGRKEVKNIFVQTKRMEGK
jgi:heterodisulfide reductase subunit C